MSIPSWSEYLAKNPEAKWTEYVSRFSAMAAQKQVEAGEIPGEYGKSHSFTPAGVWVKSGSPAAIGGLPSKGIPASEIFPGVQKYFEGQYKAVTEASVIRSQQPPPKNTTGGSTFTFGGGGGPGAPANMNPVEPKPGGVPYPPGHIYWDRQKDPFVRPDWANGGNGNGKGSGLEILLLGMLLMGGL